MRLLSTIQQDVERSFEKALRTVIVANTFGVDRTLFLNNKVGYEAAKVAVVASKGFCVETYGHGTPASRKGLDVPRFTITGSGFLPGQTGQDYGSNYSDNGDSTFTKTVNASPMSNYRIKLEIESNSTIQDRTLEAIRQASLPNQTYIPKWNDPEFFYLITYAFTASIPNYTHGLIHKIYTYEILDLVESNAEIASTTIVPTIEIKVIDDLDDETLITSVPAP